VTDEKALADAIRTLEEEIQSSFLLHRYRSAGRWWLLLLVNGARNGTV
jgi:hypothetical protein